MSALAEGSVTISAALAGVTGQREVVVDNASSASNVELGTGLRGSYFAGQTLDPAQLQGQRTDSVVKYNWDRGAAPLGVGDNFSVRFEGELEAQYTETYTFCMRSDDGIRLYVDSTPVVLNWTLHAPREDCGTIDLVAGEKYPVLIEFFENGGHAVVEMRWQSASQPKEVVPQRFLFPAE
ncbi:MAG: hypothetical protein HRT45_18720 [Bdellovibrionales bacterium]|nr:hypothetical protein [Bdellovibrionales bacterium]